MSSEPSLQATKEEGDAEQDTITHSMGDDEFDASMSEIFRDLGPFSETGPVPPEEDLGSLEGWSPVASPTTPPSARGYSTAVVHGSNIYTFGGSAGSSRKNDMQMFDVRTREWTHLDMRGEPPSPRNSHSAVVLGDQIVVFGGWDGSKNCNDLFTFEIATQTWRQVKAGGEAPRCRRGHSACALDGAMYIFGGWDGGRNFGDLHRLARGEQELEWVEFVSSEGEEAPIGRRGHSCVEYGGRLYLFGGQDGPSCFFNDLSMFNSDSASWSLVHCGGSRPMGRSYHSCVVADDALLIFGGTGSSWCFYNDLHRFSFASSTWSLVEHSGSSPSPRCFHTAVVVKDTLFVFGGARLSSDTWEYFNHLYQCILTPPQQRGRESGTLSGDLRSLLDDADFSDLTFSVEGRQIHAHRGILCARSLYFRRMLHSGMREAQSKEVVVRGIRYKVFYALLEFLYTDTLVVASDTAVELLSVASRYSMDELKRKVESHIMRNITVSNVSLIVIAADLYHATELKQVCIGFMLKEFGRVIQTESFLVLTGQHQALAKQVMDAAATHMSFSFR